MKLTILETGNLMLDGGAMFGVVPKVIWQKQYPANENNLVNLCMRSLLIIDNDKKILIDTGIGNKQDEKFFGYYFLNQLRSMEDLLNDNNLKAEDITDVIHTHLHFDHCGGSVIFNEDKTKLIPAFPNATYHISKEHWNLALKPNKLEKASLLKENFIPIQEAGQLNLIEKNCFLTPNIELKHFYGHTQGQLIAYINYKEKTIVHTADVIPIMGHIPLPYICAYDTQPLISLIEKEKLLNEAFEKNYILFFEHDIYNECCSLKKTEKGIRADKSFKLKEI